MIVSLLLQTGTSGDPNWEQLKDWLVNNWFLTVIVVLGFAGFCLVVWVVAWLLRNYGIFRTVLLIGGTAILTIVVIWLLRDVGIPRAIRFGPDGWNVSMVALGNSPDLLSPGDQLPADQPSPNETPQPDEDFPKGQWRINMPPGEGDTCTLRDGSSKDHAKIGQIPNGTQIRVTGWISSNEYLGCSFRGLIEPVAGFASGYIHCSCVAGNYIGP